MIQSYFSLPRNITLNSTYYFFMKIPKKQEFLQQIVFNDSSWTLETLTLETL